MSFIVTSFACFLESACLSLFAAATTTLSNMGRRNPCEEGGWLTGCFDWNKADLSLAEHLFALAFVWLEREESGVSGVSE